MKTKLITFLFILHSALAIGQENTYFTWKLFVDNFGKEMVKADDAYRGMVKSGLNDNCLTKLDFTFISDKNGSLVQLQEFLKTHYPYTVSEIKKRGNLWELKVQTDEIPVTADNMLYFALDMYKRGYEFDSKFETYNGVFDSQNQTFPDLNSSKEAYYFKKGMDSYMEGNLNGAIINWSLALIINPKDPNYYFSRAIVKNELFTWKAALKDYDKALEITPGFVGALINRGNLKLENGDNEGALDDYNRVLTLVQNDTEMIISVYYNRGNSKYLLNDKPGACEDWKKAWELGADYAKERIDEYCD
jgi:tetratricopeptide (TPR) repeat protein